MIFPFKEKWFPRKFLCSCMVVLPLAKIYSQLYRIFPHSDDSGWTPLHIAAHMGNREFVKLLLEKGNSPLYLRNKDGLSAFHIAAKEGNVEVMKELITKYPVVGQQGSNDSSCCCRKWNV